MSFNIDIQRIQKVPVSIVTTIFNEERTIREFLVSLLTMTVLPSEIVIVDGGSRDNTLSVLKEFEKEYSSIIGVKIIIDPTCTIHHSPAPIAKGRNIAIENASYPVIAVTDAGCLVHERWLEEISRPMLGSSAVDFVAGWYEPLAKSYFEECQAMATFPAFTSVDPESFLPSSRSVAFKKELWKKIGKYPELALGGEDTLFDLNVKEHSTGRVFRPEAVVYWRLRPNFKVFVKLVYRYGFGDGFSRILWMNAVKNTVKILIPAATIILSAIHSVLWLLATVIYLWLLPFNGNLREAFRMKHTVKYPMVSFLKITANSAYLIGYCVGLFTKKHPLFEKVSDHQQ